ncbi:GNAT family N-acetyltransferase [Leeia aquatica]|uniref:GNAT family N-acetyltransferase n=1 Tax=Leeia aquatica TaxID=2725557 RepID=A0A847SB36_9NEIS|nr:GNAT family N-acetyltransferase [Leeia aquatica]
MTPAITLQAVTPAQHGLFRALYGLYLHDLSEFTDFYQLGADGAWSPDYLPTWLAEDDPQVNPFLFWLDAQPVGLALVGARPFPHMRQDVDYRLSEFFILRHYRRCGVGRRAACALFDRLPGRWEMLQLPANTAATAFWKRVLTDYTGGQFDTLIIDGDPAQRFVSPGVAG